MLSKVVIFVAVLTAAVLAGRGIMMMQDAPSAAAPGNGSSAAAGTAKSFVRSVQVESVDEGTVYHVKPTRAGRLAGGSQLNRAWRQAVARGVPDQAGLRQQFLCHPLSVIARVKPTWDLESWRPTVGGTRTMLAACNP